MRALKDVKETTGGQITWQGNARLPVHQVSLKITQQSGIVALTFAQVHNILETCFLGNVLTTAMVESLEIPIPQMPMDNWENVSLSAMADISVC